MPAAQTPKQAGAFTPFLSQQLPGGSEILDRNLLAIKAAIGEVVDNFNRTVTFIGVGGGGSAGPYVPTARLVNTTAPLTGGGPLSADLTLALSIDGTLAVAAGLLGRAAISGDVVIAAGSNTATIQTHAVTYAKMQQEGATTILGNPSGAPANVQELTLSLPLIFFGSSVMIQGAIYAGSTLSAQNLASLASGILKQSVAAGSATIAIAAAGTDYQAPLTFSTGLTLSGSTVTANLSTGISGGQSVIGGTGLGENLTIKSTTSGTKGAILVGASGSVGVMDENSGKQSWGQASVDAFAHFVLSNDTTPTTVTAWDGRHAAFGVAGSGGGGIGVSHTTGTSTGNVLFVKPGFSWENAAVYLQTLTLFSNGTTQAITVDASQTTSMFGAVQINGVTAPSNVNLCVGHSTQSDRDRAQFFLGGGTLGPTGTGDSTLFDLTPSNTSMNGKNATGGIYATQRIRALTYTGGNLVDNISLAASLYIDAAPALTVVGGAPWAVYVAAGNMHVGGSIISTTAISSPTISGGTTTIGFFGVSAVGQQTGGAATAGATYTATEQGMINRMYSALRNYGLIS